jgi:hypothetical protein
VIEDTKRGYRPTIPQIAEKAKAIEGRRKPVFKLDKKIIPSDLSRKVEETVIQLDNQIKFITENWTLFQTIPQRDKDRLVAILRVHYEAFLKIYKMLGGKLR